MGNMLILAWLSTIIGAPYTDGLYVNTDMGIGNGSSTIYRWVKC